MARARDAAGDVGPELLAELLARGRTVELRARGASMAPLLRDGDRITLAPLDRPARRGEVVLGLRPGALFLHRVQRAEARGLLLRGDARGADDGWFLPADCPGRAVSLERKGRPLGRWRLGGARARLWMRALPLLRLLRALALRLAPRPLSQTTRA